MSEVSDKPIMPQRDPDDRLSAGLQILSFCIPIVGAIIFFSEKDKHPNKASAAWRAALLGFVLGVLIIFLMAMGQPGE